MKLWAKAGPQGNGGLNVKNAMEGLTMVSKEMESRIDKFIADNRQNIVNDIAALVNIKSVSQACDNPQAPYGEGCPQGAGQGAADVRADGLCHQEL